MGFVKDKIAEMIAIKKIGKENYNHAVDCIIDRYVNMSDSSDLQDQKIVNAYLADVKERQSYLKFAKIVEAVSLFGMGAIFVKMITQDPNFYKLEKYIVLLPVSLIVAIVIDGINAGKLNENVNFLSRYLKNHINDADLSILSEEVLSENGVDKLERKGCGDGKFDDIDIPEKYLKVCYKTAAKELIR